MITAGGTEEMREGVQECSQRGLLVQVQIKSAPLKTGGVGGVGGGGSHVIM